jgi:dTDP-4-amino-4,6-dideoxygalactose transaminase
MIPFSPPYIDDDIIEEVTAALKSGWITTGPRVAQLENETALFCKAEKVLATNSATSGLQLMLHWLGLKEGDEIIIPAYTYCATALAVLHAGGKPVMVDVGEDFNIDTNSIENAITSKTKAIITVDFAGWPCNYENIYKLINRHDVKEKFNATSPVQQRLNRIMILADAAHSFGASYQNKKSGILADVSVFSLHAVKNITTAEGGLIALNLPASFINEEVYKQLRLWSLNGQTKDAFTKSKAGGWRYDIVYAGFKINMPDVLAAIGLAQLRKYNDQLLFERRRVFDKYYQYFQHASWAINPLFHKHDCSSSYHLFPLRINNATEEQRDRIIELISEKQVAVNVHFVPMPMLTLFKEMGYQMHHYPNAYAMYVNEISLPIYPQLTNEQVDLVIKVVEEAVEKVMKKEHALI